MADKKISQLTAATTPLTGTELVPVVQNGSTVRTTAQDIANLSTGSTPLLFNGSFLVTQGGANLFTSSNNFTNLTVTVDPISGLLVIQCNQFTGAEIISIGLTVPSIGPLTTRFIFGAFFAYDANLQRYEYVYFEQDNTGQPFQINLIGETFQAFGNLSILKP